MIFPKVSQASISDPPNKHFVKLFFKSVSLLISLYYAPSNFGFLRTEFDKGEWTDSADQNIVKAVKYNQMFKTVLDDNLDVYEYVDLIEQCPNFMYEHVNSWLVNVRGYYT